MRTQSSFCDPDSWLCFYNFPIGIGTTFYYTTHGWTLLSAVIEGVSGMPFLDYLKNYVLSPLHMDTTGPEKNNPLLYNRARCFCNECNEKH